MYLVDTSVWVDYLRGHVMPLLDARFLTMLNPYKNPEPYFNRSTHADMANHCSLILKWHRHEIFDA